MTTGFKYTNIVNVYFLFDFVEFPCVWSDNHNIYIGNKNSPCNKPFKTKECQKT